MSSISPHLESQAKLLKGASDLLCEDIHSFTLLQCHHFVGSLLLCLSQKFHNVELIWKFLQYFLQCSAHLLMQKEKKKVG